MDTQNTSARPHAQSDNNGENHPSRRTRGGTRSGGVIHDNFRHTGRFTVIGNHLAQHAELSLLAIGLAVHIQSLPTGALVDIRTLAARFPEGKTRIAAALRELEAHGYLRRTCERTRSGRVITRTVSCNQPGRSGATDQPESKPKLRRPARREGEPPRRALPPYRSLRTRLLISFGPPSRSSPVFAGAIPACCSPPRRSRTSPPGSQPGWSAIYLRAPYTTP